MSKPSLQSFWGCIIQQALANPTDVETVNLHGPAGVLSSVDTGESLFVTGTETEDPGTDTFWARCHIEPKWINVESANARRVA